MDEIRDEERQLPFDPAEAAADGQIVFIGKVASPWTDRSACPKNMRAARELAQPARIELDPRYREGLAGLQSFDTLIVLTWLDRSRRDLIVQKPRHAETARGVFALRSPVRPNPIGLHVVRMTALDLQAGTIDLEAIDVLDGTPVIDIKPYYRSTDLPHDVMEPAR
jgi:tRNA (adenine37-N6)-methyltransferase